MEGGRADMLGAGFCAQFPRPCHSLLPGSLALSSCQFALTGCILPTGHLLMVGCAMLMADTHLK